MSNQNKIKFGTRAIGTSPNRHIFLLLTKEITIMMRHMRPNVWKIYGLLQSYLLVDFDRTLMRNVNEKVTDIKKILYSFLK